MAQTHFWLSWTPSTAETPTVLRVQLSTARLEALGVTVCKYLFTVQCWKVLWASFQRKSRSHKMWQGARLHFSGMGQYSPEGKILIF